ncbi:MAG: hypothetical protein NT069_12465, partial [Planctomycetota bacterium]|nr:hypothetical protein [Planctomycetota bacterium]
SQMAEHAFSQIKCLTEKDDLSEEYEGQSGVVVICGDSSWDWVKTAAKKARTLAIKKKWPALAIYVGPPNPLRELSAEPANFTIIREGVGQSLDEYLSKLRAAHATKTGLVTP